MRNKRLQNEVVPYRVLFGKLFSSLLHRFGSDYIVEIEDAIQNSFLKSLKLWRPDSQPNNVESWLFIVARHDVLNQIKKQKLRHHFDSGFVDDSLLIEAPPYDLRLQTLIFISSIEKLSKQAKILFSLKNIFGLSVVEISTCTLMQAEAIYKSVRRSQKTMQLAYRGDRVDFSAIQAGPQDVAVLEEILYAVFNLGFDSFHEQLDSVINEDICLEAFALTKLLFKQYQLDSTSHLLSLFCFHMARIPAKIDKGKLVSFFKQKREKWNTELIQLGFQYLVKPKNLSKLYLEATILSRYMSKTSFTQSDWLDIVKLYEIMLSLVSSPIIALNYCFCLRQAGKKEQAWEIVAQIEKELPPDHIYFSLVKADMLRAISPEKADHVLLQVMNQLKQKIRKDFLLENELIICSYESS